MGIKWVDRNKNEEISNKKNAALSLREVLSLPKNDEAIYLFLDCFIPLTAGFAMTMFEVVFVKSRNGSLQQLK